MILAAILTHQDGAKPTLMWTETNVGTTDIRPFAVEPGTGRVSVALAAMDDGNTKYLGYRRVLATHAPLIVDPTGITLESLGGDNALEAIEARRTRNNLLADQIYQKLGGGTEDDYRIVEVLIGAKFAVFHYVVISDTTTEDECGVRSADRHFFLVRCTPANWQNAHALLPLSTGVVNGVLGYIEGEEELPTELPSGFVAAPLVRNNPAPS